MEAIEKQRKVLSANSDSTLNIEYLMEDVDLNQHLKREEFEELVAPALKVFHNALSMLAT